MVVASRVYSALVHWPIRDRAGGIITTAVTNIDVHDLSRSARTYDLAGFFVVTPIAAQQELVGAILGHWRHGPGLRRVPERTDALSLCEVVPTLRAAREAVLAREGVAPVVVVTAARSAGVTPKTFAAERADLVGRTAPTLVVFGTGHGLAQSVLDEADILLEPIAGRANYNHLSVRAACAITLDRLFV